MVKDKKKEEKAVRAEVGRVTGAEQRRRGVYLAIKEIQDKYGE